MNGFVNPQAKTFFFCGIGGSGMSAIAEVLLHQGYGVCGSDRSRDRGQNPELYARLSALGAQLYAQDGSGIADADTLVVSSAVEPSIPDVQVALSRNMPILKRAEVLAWLFNQGAGIAVGGTSGKTTVTGMIGHILVCAGRNPTVINGGAMLSAGQANAICGDPRLPVVEADESDGTIVLYDPTVAVLTNISLDHKPLEELETLFGDFCARAKDAAVVNLDCAHSAALTKRMHRRVAFGVENPGADVNATDVALLPDGVRFSVGGAPCRLQVPGRHNAANAAAAIAAVGAVGVDVTEATAALGSFLGIGRRLQVVGEAGGVVVIDDFAHNPDKIAASLAALKAQPGRLLVVFQPHGYGPTRFLKAGLIASFAQGLGTADWVVMPEIFYAGGTAQKDISSRDLTDGIAALGRQAVFVPLRSEIVEWLAREVRSGDRVVVMGARDDTLTAFAREILARVGKKKTG